MIMQASTIVHSLFALAGAIRTDGWENVLTGFGTSRDKTRAGQFTVDNRIPDTELSAMYHCEGIVSRVVNIFPREMLREGFGISCTDTAAAEVVARRVRELDVVRQYRDGFTWGRLFGGAGLLIGADDGLDPRLPLDESRIRSLSYLQMYDRRRMYPQQWYDDGRDQKFNQPSIYTLSQLRTGRVSDVHESRLILFGGAHTAEQEKLQFNGFDYSVLQSAYDTLRQFGNTNKAGELMMTDASQAVFKLKGLMAMIASGSLELIQARAQLLDMTRSIARAVFLDADGSEEYSKQATSFAGVADMLDRSANLLAAVSEIPVTILMGQAPAGLSATGASDIRMFYDRIKSAQTHDLKPRLERLIRLIAISERLGDRKFGILFPALWQETPKEKAEREKTEAETANIWITAEVLTPEKVAIARFGSTEPQPYRVDPARAELDPALSNPKTPIAGQAPPAAVTPTEQTIKIAPDFVLNGAQIVAANTIVSEVVAGTLPRDAGIGQLVILFNLSTAQAEQIMGSAGKGFKAPAPPAAPVPGA